MFVPESRECVVDTEKEIRFQILQKFLKQKLSGQGTEGTNSIGPEGGGAKAPGFFMKQFRAYVSRAQEGILSENPSAEGFDRVPSIAEARERAAAGTLQESLRAEDMRDAVCEAMHTLKECTEKDCIGSHSCGADLKSESVPLPEEDLSKSAAAPRGSIFSRRAILLAILVNIVLGLVLALVMHLDRPEPPKYVYYIELTDRPDSTGQGVEKKVGKESVQEPEAASSQPGEQ